LSTKLAPRHAFFGLFHSWTVIGMVSLTITPHWFTNFVACYFGSNGLPSRATTSMLSFWFAFNFWLRPCLEYNLLDPDGWKKKESLIHIYICIFPSYHQKLNLYTSPSVFVSNCHSSSVFVCLLSSNISISIPLPEGFRNDETSSLP
jgi:hypothetical protein